jgi:hypothetical protein
MSRIRLSKAAALGCVLALLPATAFAGGALVKVDGIVLRADGDFQPTSLPRQRFVPIHFEGHFDIAAAGGGRPVALEQVVIDFDRDGRLDSSGLPVCQPERIADASTAEARQACAGAIVGSGRIEALIDIGGGPVAASSPLTIFNGPRVAGNPSVVLHARITVPSTQTYAIVVPIERRRGSSRYRATLDLPPIAAGFGSVTHVAVKVGRRFSSGGQQRSYVSGRCSIGILRTHGRFSFADGTIIDGNVEKPCTPR